MLICSAVGCNSVRVCIRPDWGAASQGRSTAQQPRLEHACLQFSAAVVCMSPASVGTGCHLAIWYSALAIIQEGMAGPIHILARKHGTSPCVFCHSIC